MERVRLLLRADKIRQKEKDILVSLLVRIFHSLGNGGSTMNGVSIRMLTNGWHAVLPHNKLQLMCYTRRQRKLSTG